MEWPTIDWDDNYPTDESMAEAESFFAKADLDFNKAAAFILEELPKCARNCCARCDVTDAKDDFDSPVKRVEFATGGWSGAEEVIGLVQGRFDMRHFWESWHRGGLYIFEIPAHFLPLPPTP